MECMILDLIQFGLLYEVFVLSISHKLLLIILSEIHSSR
jgi:hypothetical protein